MKFGSDILKQADVLAGFTEDAPLITRTYLSKEHKAAGEYEDALKRRGLQTMWLTTKVNDSALPNSLSAMYDFCAMIRTKELVGMVRSTFVVWAALLGNEDGVARLYSVDSRATRKQFSKNGKPIFRTYNWTHPRLQRRIHFELYQADAVDALSA